MSAKHWPPWRRPARDETAARSEDDPGSAGWTTAGDGTSRIYVDLVRVACSPVPGGWLPRFVTRGRETQNGLEHPVHGWLREGDQAARFVGHSDRTLCGLRLDDLRWQDLDHLRWADVQSVLRCRICSVVLD